MRKLKLSVMVIAACAWAGQAMASGVFCASHDKLADILQSKFGEQKLGMGLAGHEAMVELFVSAKGTFTLVSTNVEGLACIVGAGDSWEKADMKDEQAAL